MKEYDWLMEAKQLSEVDDSFKAHRQAFLNFQVQATKKNGRPVYKHFDKFFDYKKELDSIRKKMPHEDKFAALKQHIREEKHDG